MHSAVHHHLDLLHILLLSLGMECPFPLLAFFVCFPSFIIWTLLPPVIWSAQLLTSVLYPPTRFPLFHV